MNAPADAPRRPLPAQLGLTGLVVGAVGVVFGDIGTSPLYTLREAFSGRYGLTPDPATVLGVLSLIFWALMLVVALKYVSLLMRADNEGEGGIMALMALAQRHLNPGGRVSVLVGFLGVLGAALFFGDGVLTPAITVLAALEGLEVIEPALHPFIVPLAVALLVALFATQRLGSARVGRVFGPVMVLWFSVLAVLGAVNIGHAPEVLRALNPWWAAQFFVTHHWHGVFILGAVVLAVSGGAALYTDMGHFGARPIRLAWFGFVLPALMLNYLGQGALLLENPDAIGNPFYVGVPAWARGPVVALATLAAVIACQAVMTGAFSIARQAMLLGYLPRMTVRHTSRATIGQIYIPAINWLMMVLVIGLVLRFGSASALASAYGLSVAASMLIDSLLLAVVASVLWARGRRWLWLVVLPLCAGLGMLDVAFLAANSAKLLQGGGFPVALAVLSCLLMRTWQQGRTVLAAQTRAHGVPLAAFLPSLLLAPPVRVEGTAVFLTGHAELAPPAMLHNLKHNKVLHARNVFLSVRVLTVPYVRRAQRMTITNLGHGFYRIALHFGFMQTPDVPRALALVKPGTAHQAENQTEPLSEPPSEPENSLRAFEPMETTYFVSRATIVASAALGMPVWRDKLFALMHRNAAPADGVFQIPGNRVVALGAPVEI